MNFPKKWLVLGVVVLLLVILGGSCVHSYNKLVGLNENVGAQWGKVEGAYQRRADLVQNLVTTAQKAANVEKDILTSVINARASATQVKITADDLKDPAKLKQFEDAQNQLGQSLGRLLVVSEQYPELKSLDAFKNLAVTLEQTENRINVERDRFNDAAREFNTQRDSFPTVIMAGFFGSKFSDKAYFQAKPGADTAPTVQFDK